MLDSLGGWYEGFPAVASARLHCIVLYRPVISLHAIARIIGSQISRLRAICVTRLFSVFLTENKVVTDFPVSANICDKVIFCICYRE